MKSIKNHEHGLTLVEILVVIIIMGVISSMIYRFMFFGTNSFIIGSEYIDNTANLRMTTYKISDEIRNVRNIDLQSSTGDVTLEEHIWLDTNTLKYNDPGDNDFNMSDDLIQSISYSLGIVNENYVLTITLTGEDSRSVTTEVLLNNIPSSYASITNTSGSVVEFDFNAP